MNNSQPLQQSTRLRSTELRKQQTKDSPKPPRLFQHGQLVSWKGGKDKYGTTNVMVYGHEWGEYHRDFKREVWVYYVRPEGTMAFMAMVAEDELSRIT